MKLIFPKYATQCLETIENNGYEAWFVGGCVRDALLDREFYDVDITTNALPEDIIRIFEKTVPTGVKHGTVTVIIEGEPIEVTTYRSEDGYSDSRHPESVNFESNIDCDLSRRDLTINALAYHPTRGLLDLFGGFSDLENKKIAAVGTPETRFTEDALRILRVFRFSSTLGFDIESSTLSAAYKCSDRLQFLSGERILAELKKLSYGKNPNIIERLINSGAFKQFGINSADLNLNLILDISLEYRAAALLSLCDTNIKLIKENLKPDNILLDNMQTLKEISKLSLPTDKTELKNILFSLGESNTELYFEALKINADKDALKDILQFRREIEENFEPYLIKHLSINGSDIVKLGASGVRVGEILSELALIVIKEPYLNNKDTLLELVNKIM